MSDHYELVVVGSGFASAFFLREYLRLAEPNARVLVLERGRAYDRAWQFSHRAHSDVAFDEQIINETPQKPWLANIAFGGGACWTGNTPRMLPNDFRTKTLYGVGDDWPIDYETLEPCYQEVEEVMAIAGAEGGPYPRSRPYPLPAHYINALDEAFLAAFPGEYLPMPSARASIAIGDRPACCGNGVCSHCPIGAKFQVDFHMQEVFSDPRVTVQLESNVKRIDIAADTARAVEFVRQGKTGKVSCDLVAVGAHAIMSPFILLSSGLEDPALGRYLNEQIGLDVSVYLKGIKNYGATQATTGLGTMFMDGEFRRERAGCLVENWNSPWLRAEAGRWREKGYLKLVFEDMPSADNYVALSAEDPDRPIVHFGKHSDYMKAGFAAAPELLERLFEHVPHDAYEIHEMEGLSSDAHIQGTTRMGSDPQTSVVDKDLRHHRVRNLLALGSGVFPTCPTANPTLTLSALSVLAARRLFS